MNVPKKVYESNRDLLLRVKKEKVTVNYFKREDVFRLFIGKSKNSLGLTIGNGLLTVHYDPKTYKIYGFTVPYVKEFIMFCEYFESQKYQIENQITKKDPKLLVDPIANAGMASLSVASC